MKPFANGWLFSFEYGGKNYANGPSMIKGVRYSVYVVFIDEDVKKVSGYLQLTVPCCLEQVQRLVSYASWKIALGTPESNYVDLSRKNDIVGVPVEKGRFQLAETTSGKVKKVYGSPHAFQSITKPRMRLVWREKIGIEQFFVQAPRTRASKDPQLHLRKLADEKARKKLLWDASWKF